MTPSKKQLEAGARNWDKRRLLGMYASLRSMKFISENTLTDHELVLIAKAEKAIGEILEQWTNKKQ